MKQMLYIFILSVIPLLVDAQTNYKVNTIPDSLKTNAHSVVRSFDINMTMSSPQQGECSYKQVITILDKEGKSNSGFECYTDNFRTLNDFSGELYNADGQRISKIKKSDLKSTDISEGLASDDKTYFYECPQENYPFTVVYEWKIKYRNGMLSFPTFFPISNYNQSLQSACYTLSVPQNIGIQHRLNQKFNIPLTEKSIGEAHIYCWNFPSQSAIEPEEFLPPFINLIPNLYVEPISFSYGNYDGRQQSWQELADWNYSLQNERDILPEAVQSKIKEMTASLSGDYEKVRKLYQYLGETTRYVSIQLGIGGLQPMTVADVARLGFGDCKALSFYMKAMLQVIGIPSIYTPVSTQNKKLSTDYPSIAQMNHVILCVPLKEETLWLECTNPSIPFGYIHEDIAGHDALLAENNKGRIATLPDYPDSLNLQTYHALIELTDGPQTKAIVTCTSYLSQYESRYAILKKKNEDQINDIRKRVKLPQAQITDVKIKEIPDRSPSITEEYTLTALYGTKSGNRFFVPLTPFREVPFTVTKKERKQDIYLHYGYLDQDTLQIKLPDNYQLESKPKDVNESFPFGSITSSVNVENHTITIRQSLHIKKGIYKPSQITELASFEQAIKRAYNSKIILKKCDL